MINEGDPEQLAGKLEQEADELERQSDRVEGEIAETRSDWERKRRDESIAGAPPPERNDEDEGDDEGEGEDEGDQISEDAPPSKD
jgi:hypothetical protein